MNIRYARRVSAALLLCVLSGSIIMTCFGSTGGATAVDHDPLKIILSMKDGYEKIDSYIAVMVKGEPALSRQKAPQRVNVKFKKPFKVYMKWFDPLCNGREVLYIPSTNDDYFFVKPEGVLGFLIRRVKLPSTFKTGDSRYSVRDFGIGNLIDGIVEVTLDAQKNNDLDLRFKGVVMRNGREVYFIERRLPKKDRYLFQRLVLYVDTKTRLPLEVYAYNDKGKLAEYCLFEDITLNPRLKDEEFSVDNAEYGFKYL